MGWIAQGQLYCCEQQRDSSECPDQVSLSGDSGWTQSTLQGQEAVGGVERAVRTLKELFSTVRLDLSAQGCDLKREPLRV